MRWFSTLRGQFVMVVAAAVILSNIAVVVILAVARVGEIRGVRTEALVERAASNFDLLRSLTPEQRGQAVAAFSSRFVQYWLAPASPIGNHVATAEERAMAKQMGDNETNKASGPIEVQLFDSGGDVPNAPPNGRLREQTTSTVVVAQRLQSGQWLVVRLARPTAPPLGFDIFFAAALATILTCAAAAWLSGRVSRPLSALAAGADEMARGRTAPHLSTRGPDDVRRAAEAFNAMSDRVTRTLESHRQLLSAVGHDLRTPIAAMRISAEFVNDDEVRDRLVRSLEELQSLTESVLSAARATPGENMRPVDLAALVQSVCDDLSDLDQPVDADIHGPAACLCRPNEIRRAARNLIENAVRYGGSAHVTLSNGGANYVMAVEDEGPGIPTGQLDAVFEPFMRLEQSRSAATGGSGLGLTLARSIAREHGGDVTLTNLAKGGLRAELRLPCTAMA